MSYLSIVKTIDVSNNPSGISSDGRYVWVANNSMDRIVTQIDAITGIKLQNINTGRNSAFGISSDGRYVWVSHSYYISNNVTQIDASNGFYLGSLTAGINPSGISSDGRYVWVANNGSQSITQFDASNGSFITNIYDGSMSQPYGVSSNGKNVWVANLNDSVSQIDASNGIYKQTISINGPYATSADKKYVWIANLAGKKVIQLDASNGTVINSGIDISYNPQAISSDGKYVYVVSSDLNNSHNNIVTQLDASNGNVINKIDISNNGTAQGITSYGKYVWVTKGTPSNTVTQIRVYDPSYNIEPSVNSLIQGGTVTYAINTTDVSNNTRLYWDNSGSAPASYFTDGSNTGSFQILDNSFTLVRTLINTLPPNGIKSLIVNLRTGSNTGSIVKTASTVNIRDPSYNVIPNISTLIQGQAVTYAITTSDVSNNTTLYWDNSGSTPASYFTDASNTGSFKIIDNSYNLVRTLIDTLPPDGNISDIKLNLRTGSNTGTIVKTASTVTVRDPSYNIVPDVTTLIEGDTVTYAITTKDVSNNTILYWDNSGSSPASYFTDLSNTGSFQIINNSYSLVRTLINTLPPNGIKSLIVNLRTGSNTGSIVKTAQTVSIFDPSYNIVPNVTTLTQGQSVTYRINTFNVPNNTTLFWDNSGSVSAGYFTDGLTSNSLSIFDNSYSLVRTIVNPLLLEGIKSLKMNLRTGSASGAIVKTANTVTINGPLFNIVPDVTSLYYGQSPTVTYSITTTNITNNTTLYWNNSGSTAPANYFTDAFNSGSITINNNHGILTRTLTNQAYINNVKTLIINLLTNSISGTIVAIAQTVLINDFNIYYTNTPYALPTSSPCVIDISYIGIIPTDTVFRISPALPAGLLIDPSNGIISGNTTFASISPLKNYTVDASYSIGIVTTNLGISVGLTPTFYYPNTPYIIQQNKFTSNIQPVYLISNIQNISYSVISSPPLSDISMNLNNNSGLIFGTPLAYSPPTNYTIRANNAGVIYDTSLNISVQSIPTISYPSTNYTLTQDVDVSIIPIADIFNTGITYSIDGCALPTGLNFNTATGEIYGTPLLTTTFRKYTVTVTNVVGNSSAILVINVIKVILAPRVVADNIDAGLCLTNPIMAMRRKAEILKYKNNSAGFTKNQNWSLAVKGNGPYAKRVWANQNGLESNPNISGLPVQDNTIICNSNSNGIVCAPTSSSDVPGPIMNLCYDPTVPLVGYSQPNRTRVNIGFKWPQRAWQIGDMGFPVGKAGRNNS